MQHAESTMEILKEALAGARPAQPKVPAVWIAAAILVTVLAYAEYREYAEPISGQQLYVLSGLVEQAGTNTARTPPELWQRIFDRFGVESPLGLRRREFGDAVEFIAGIARQRPG